MSSQYPVLDNRRIDQWKVTELREELRRRKIPTRGLKEDLVKRLAEALCSEREPVVEELGNVFNSKELLVNCDDEKTEPIVSQMVGDDAELVKCRTEKVDYEEVNMVDVDDKTAGAPRDCKVQDEELMSSTEVDGLVEETVIVSVATENCTTATKNLLTNVESSREEPTNDETDKEVDSKSHANDAKPDMHIPDVQIFEEDLKSKCADVKLDVFNLNNLVSSEDSKPQVEVVKIELSSSANQLTEDSCLEDVNVSNLNQLPEEDSKPCPEDLKLNICDPNNQVPEEDSKPCLEDIKQDVSNTINQVSEVSQVKPQVEVVKIELSNSVNQLTEDPCLEDVNVSNLTQRPEEDKKPCPEDLMLNICDPNNQVPEEDSKPCLENIKQTLSNTNNKVSEVSLEKCESIYTDSVSINKKNELKDNFNADNFPLQMKFSKPEMVQPSSSDVPPSSLYLHSLDGQESGRDEGFMEKVDDHTAGDLDLPRNNDSVYGGSTEKLNLDRSSSDESMEEDTLESKHIFSNCSGKVVDRSEVSESHYDKVQRPVDAVVIEFSADRKNINAEKNDAQEGSSEKRELEDIAVGNNKPSKRQRKWSSETVKVSEQLTSKPIPSTAPKEAYQSAAKRLFTRSDSTLDKDVPKERIVPPSQKSPTTSLRIDHFVRPFTLKAVQELLARTGTVCSFWMDQIKTHCYVTYSSMEEATETRNALYNLQWPSYGGHYLVADFVDPQEVKMRVASAPHPPVAPSPTSKAAPSTSSLQPQHPPPLKNSLKQQLPPPPPLPASDLPPAREQLRLPPTPPPQKSDPPFVTLDDLFRKTRATPRIYYLPLSEEQVTAKLASQGRNLKVSRV